VAGKTWRVGKFTIGVVEKFIGWIREEAADPFEGLDKLVPLMPRDEALALIKEAREAKAALASMDLNSPEIQKWARTARGAFRLLYFMLQQNHPEVTLDDVFAIAMEVGSDHVAKAIASGQGVVPGGNAEALPAKQ
jgi:hypothetical protein